MKIYTKTGDDGTTSLYSGERKSKDDPLFHVIGLLDEVNAHLGVAICHLGKNSLTLLTFLYQVQNLIFDLGANIATIGHNEKTTFNENNITLLEKEIDRYDLELEPLRTFILPGGSLAAAHLHLCRTSTRTCERAAIGHVSPNVLKFINRLSDYFFAAARYANYLQGIEDVKWKSSPSLYQDEKREEPSYTLFLPLLFTIVAFFI